LAGYFGYDAVRYIEPKLAHSCQGPDTLGTPDIQLLQCEELAVIDNLSGKLYLIVYADPAQSPRPLRQKAFARLREQLQLFGQRRLSAVSSAIRCSASSPRSAIIGRR
jgi:anthranilate synthase component I